MVSLALLWTQPRDKIVPLSPVASTVCGHSGHPGPPVVRPVDPAIGREKERLRMRLPGVENRVDLLTLKIKNSAI